MLPLLPQCHWLHLAQRDSKGVARSAELHATYLVLGLYAEGTVCPFGSDSEY